MSVEQTTQLIQLILNSVLMAIATVLTSASLLTRYSRLREEVWVCQRHYRATVIAVQAGEGEMSDRLQFLKHRLQTLTLGYQTVTVTVQVLYLALGLFVSSTLMLSLRTLLNWNPLISMSLLLFVGGTALLLLGIGLALVEFYRSRSHWHSGLSLRSDERELPMAIAPKRSDLSPRRRSMPCADGSIRPGL